MIQTEHCKYGHYIMHQKLPKPIQDIINANGRKKNHKYETRHKATPNVQKHTVLCAKSIIEYNKLSMNLKFISKTKPFIRQLKMNMLNEI